MNDYIKIPALILIGCFAIAFLRERKKEYSLIAVLVCGSAVFLYALEDIRYIAAQIYDYIELTGIDSNAFTIFFKAVSIALISQCVCEICTDTGNRFLGFCVELAGKAAVLLVSLPLLNSVMIVIRNYLGV